MFFFFLTNEYGLVFCAAAEDVFGKRSSLYPLLPGAPATGGHSSAMSDEPESHMVGQQEVHMITMRTCLAESREWLFAIKRDHNFD